MFGKKHKARVASNLIPDNSPLKTHKLSLIIMGFLVLLTFFGGLVFGLYSFANYKYEAKPKGEVRDIVFTVGKGNGLSTIAANLESQGLIDDAFLFKLITKLRGNEAKFKAGEFSVSYPASMSKIYKTLSEGPSILYPFTAPEGLTSAQIMRLILSSETITGDDPTLAEEGSLLPETYLLPRAMLASDLIKKMQKAQSEVLNELWETRQEGLPIKTKEEAIILASIVEKETGLGGERDLVAGVFINRLNKGMRLESDPTIIYGISKGEPLGRGLRRSEIDRKTDWNTYQIPRLPITPICNPGREAIAAVLNPAETEAIFFVADGTGGHVFSKTLAEHNRNVVKWRKIERARKRAKTP